MPTPYTESASGHVARVWPGDARHPTQVIMRDELRNTTRYYTWNHWAASFCHEAADSQKPITLSYSVTSWGRLIDDVDYAEATA